MAQVKLRDKIDFIVSKRMQGMSYQEIAEVIEKTFGISVHPTSISRFVVRQRQKIKKLKRELKPLSMASAAITKTQKPNNMPLKKAHQANPSHKFSFNPNSADIVI